MSPCPYPERNINRGSGNIETNRLYLAWHEGYEAHKFEMANQSVRIANLVVELEAKIKSVDKVNRELKKRKIQY